MNSKLNQIVISASRRTDIPAFYMTWFMKQLEKGFFEVTNPYNRKVSIVPATADKVHTIVFWSKNFDPFIKGRYGEKILKMGYNIFFNYTINSQSYLLEPNILSLNKRFEQLSYLCKNFGPECINWRFDPICLFKIKSTVYNNLNDFSLIANMVSQFNINRCITSFMDSYLKITKRTATIKDFSFIYPDIDKQKEIILKMKKKLDSLKINLYTCCEKKLINALPKNSFINKSSCIPNDLLMKLFGGNLSLKKDYGQRISKGCGCMTSVDIGSYSLHPCYHNCLFCYANPSPKQKYNHKKT